MPYLTWILAAGGLFVAGWAGIRTVRDQPVIFKQLIAAGVVLALAIVSMVVAGIQMALGHHLDDPVLFWGYCIAGAILFPIAGVWAIAERTRWSSVVLLVAGVAFAIVQLRVHALWVGA